LIIRAEQPSDRSVIYHLNTHAFGQPAEAELVDALRREPGFDAALSLVLEVDDVIVGHILFSPILIDKTPALALAPMAVLPKRQRRGAGSMLVRRGLETCTQLGHRIVVVIGHPEFYPRFGFTQARPYGIESPFPVPDEVFMVRELVPGGLSGVSGKVIYPPPFNAV
jgi:putative acetyltransferase